MIWFNQTVVVAVNVAVELIVIFTFVVFVVDDVVIVVDVIVVDAVVVVVVNAAVDVDFVAVVNAVIVAAAAISPIVIVVAGIVKNLMSGVQELLMFFCSSTLWLYVTGKGLFRGLLL